MTRRGQEKQQPRGDWRAKACRSFPRLISKLAKRNPDLACRLDVQGEPAFKDEHGRRWFRPVPRSSHSKERQK